MRKTAPVPEHFLALDGLKTVKTLGYLSTRRAIDDLANVHGMGVIHGDAGNGKTFSVRASLEYLNDAEASWFDFPGRATTKEIVRALLEEITGIPHESSRARLEAILLDRLSERPRVLVVDEAQRLYDESIEYLRHLYDRPDTRFALVLVGGNDCWERISGYPMVWSRIYRNVRFEPLALEEVREHIPRLHAVYADAEPALIERIDEQFAHGNLRNWTKFTADALQVMSDNELSRLSDDVTDAVFDLHGAAQGSIQ